jgi:NADH:ubiquinone oxidoreductase subunit E
MKKIFPLTARRRKRDMTRIVAQHPSFDAAVLEFLQKVEKPQDWKANPALHASAAAEEFQEPHIPRPLKRPPSGGHVSA